MNFLLTVTNSNEFRPCKLSLPAYTNKLWNARNSLEPTARTRISVGRLGPNDGPDQFTSF